LQVYLLLKALQVLQRTIISSPQFGQGNLTKLALAKMFVLQLVHFNIFYLN
jgi:hypothetical protein